MGTPVSKLSDVQKKRLEDLVTELVSKGESEEVIRYFVDEFKSKYSQAPQKKEEMDFASALKVKNNNPLNLPFEQKRLQPRLSKAQEQERAQMISTKMADPELAKKNEIKAQKRQAYSSNLQTYSEGLNKLLETGDKEISKEISERKFTFAADAINQDLAERPAQDNTTVMAMDYKPGQISNQPVLKSEIDSYKETAKNDPMAQRVALSTIARRNPEKGKEIQAYAYALDATQRGAHEDDLRGSWVHDNIEKIKSGELVYDLKSGTLMKPESFLEGIATGGRERLKQLDLYNALNNASDEEAIKIIEGLPEEDDLDLNPMPVPRELANALGSEGIPMLMSAGATVITKNPAAGGVITAPEYYRRSYAGGFIQAYNELVSQGTPKEEAIKIARAQAEEEGKLGAIEGGVSSFIGGRIGLRNLPKVNLGSGFKRAVGQLLKESGDFAKETTIDGLADAMVAGGLQYTKNLSAIQKGIERDQYDGVKENMVGELSFAFAVGGATKAISGTMNLSSKLLNRLNYNIAKQDPAIFDATVADMVGSGQISEDEATKLISVIDKYRKIDQSIPSDVAESSRVKIAGKITEREGLEKELETKDKAYHSEIKEKIKAINEDILELSKNKEEQVEEEEEVEEEPKIVDDTVQPEETTQLPEKNQAEPPVEEPVEQPLEQDEFDLELDKLLGIPKQDVPQAEFMRAGKTPLEISQNIDLMGPAANLVTIEDLGITKEDGTRDVIEKFSKLDTPLKPLFEFILQDKDFKNEKVHHYKPGENPTIDKYMEVSGADPSYYSGAYFPKSKFKNDSLFGSLSGQVLYNPNVVGSPFKVLAHEIMHQYTLDTKRGIFESLLNMPKMDELKSIYYYIRDSKPVDPSVGFTESDYGLYSFPEFMAELITSPSFRKNIADVVASKKDVKQLSKISIKDADTFIQRVQQAFRDLINMIFDKLGKNSKGEYDKPLLDEALRLMESVFFDGKEVLDRSQSDSNMSFNQGALGSALAMPSKSERDAIVSKAKSDGTYLKAPNGKPTKLTENQWVAVRTKAFKDWFGDWENDPQNASKIVDKNGEPLVVYHGTRKQFDTFKLPADVERENSRDDRGGIWFTDNKENAESFKKEKFLGFEKKGKKTIATTTNDFHVKDVFLNVRNPIKVDKTSYNSVKKYIIRAVGEREFKNGEVYAKSIGKDGRGSPYYKESYLLKGIGGLMYDDKTIDGIVWLKVKDNILATNYQIYNPNQIKSATSNSGNFSKEDNSILAMPAGKDGIKELVDRFRGIKTDEEIAKALEKRGIDPSLYLRTQPKQGEKAIATMAMDSMAPQQVKDKIAELGLKYQIEKWEDAEKNAQALIEYLGPDRAFQAVKDGDIQGAAASFVWAKAIDAIGEEYASETDPQKKEALADKQASRLSEYDEMMRDAGRKISALQKVYKMSKMGYKFYISKQIDRINSSAFSDAEKARISDLETKLKEELKKSADLLATNQELINKLNSISEIKTLSPEKETRKRELSKKIGDRVKAILNRAPLLMAYNTNPQVDMLMSDPEVVEFLSLVSESSNNFDEFKKQLSSVSKELSSVSLPLFRKIGRDEKIDYNPETSLVNALRGKIKDLSEKQFQSAIKSLGAYRSGVWGKYKDKAASTLKSRIEKGVFGSDVRSIPPLEMFVKGLVSNLNAMNPSTGVQKQNKSTDIEIAADAIRNPEKYSEVLEKTKAEIEEKILNENSDVNTKTSKLLQLDSYFQEYFSSPFSKKLVDDITFKGVKDLLGDDYSKKLLSIAREYFLESDTLGQSLLKYLSYKTGLSENELSDLSEMVERAFDDILNKRVKSEIERIYPIVKAKKKTSKKEYQKIVEAINVGLKTGVRKNGSPFNFQEEFSNKFGLVDKNDPEVVSALDRFAENIYKTRNNPLYHAEATIEMLDWIEDRKNKNKVLSVITEQVYANMLYGQDTHFRNTTFNIQKVSGALISMMLQSPFTKNSAFNMLKNFTEGLNRGFVEAGSAIKTGKSRAGDDPKARKFSERMASQGNKWGMYASVPSRLLSAMDSSLNFPLRRARMAFILQEELQKANPSLTKREVSDLVNKYISGTPEQIAEWEKRSKNDTMERYGLNEPMFVDGERNPKYSSGEYDKAYRDYKRSFYLMQEESFYNRSVFDEAKDYADHQLLLSKPKGWFGYGASIAAEIGMAHPLLKILTTPFVNVPFNVAAHLYEFSPLGFTSVIANKDGIFLNEEFAKRKGIDYEISPRRRRELAVKATIGTLGMAAVGALTALKYYDEEEGKERPVLIVMADGTGNYSNNTKIAELSGSDKFQEYTIDFMGARMSYKYSPFAAWFIPSGLVMDKERYGEYGNKSEKEAVELAASAFVGYFLFMKDQSSIQGLTDLFNIGNQSQQFSKDKSFQEKVMESAKRSGANMLRSLVLPNFIPQSYRQYKGFMEMEENRATSFLDRLTKDVPFADQFVNKKYDHFGQPINAKWKIPGIYDSQGDGNTLYDLARDKNYLDQLDYFNNNKVVDYDGTEYILTEQQMNQIAKRRAEIAGEEFNQRFSELQGYEQQFFTQEANQIFKDALERAAAEILGFAPRIRTRSSSDKDKPKNVQEN